MNNADKFLLLVSLSFFFACFAVSLIALRGPKTGPSYMYSPQAAPAQTAPVEDITRQYGRVLPKSILHYPLDTPEAADTVTCYLKEAYKERIAEIVAADGVRLAVKAEIGEDDLEIYVNEDGDFSVFVIGPDALDQPESCEVARGSGWQPISP